MLAEVTATSTRPPVALAGGVTTILVVPSLTIVPVVPPKVTLLPLARKLVPVMVTSAGRVVAWATPSAGLSPLIEGAAT